MNPVVIFLPTRKGYTFEEGVAFFAMYADRYAVERVKRSHDMRRLVQELKKLAHVPNLKPVSGCIVPKVEESVPKVEESVPKDKENVPAVEKPEQRIVSFDDLKHYKYTSYDDMPTPETKALWQRNNDRWHLKIDLFAKMKLLPEGEELAKVRNELVEVSREHRACWKLIDKLCDEFYAKKEQTGTETTQTAPDFNISTYRAYICKMLAADKISDNQFVTLQQRVTEMLAAHIAFDAETLEKLRAKGINC